MISCVVKQPVLCGFPQTLIPAIVILAVSFQCIVQILPPYCMADIVNVFHIYKEPG